MDLGAVREFLIKWFRGPGGAEYRDVFWSLGDPREAKKKLRLVVSEAGFENAVLRERLLKNYQNSNIFIGVGFVSNSKCAEAYVDRIREMPVECLLYDAVHIDFDCDEKPELAVKSAVSYARILKRELGTDPIVYSTGLKGARVVVGLESPVDFESYRAIALRLLMHYSGKTTCGNRSLIDMQMINDAKHLSRPPFTYNVKAGARGFAEPVLPKFKPEEFDWGSFELLDPQAVKVIEIDEESYTIPVRKPRPRVRGGKQPLPERVEDLANCDAVPHAYVP